MTTSNISRRKFLKGLGACGVMSQTTALSSLLSLNLTQAAAAATSNAGGYKAMVCVLLHGGIDSYNMLVPTDSEALGGYQAARGNLALDPATLLPIHDPRSGRNFGLHPGLGELQGLYNSGNLSFLANVGSLIEPVTQASYRNSALPLGLFSHSDLQRHWQTSVPQSRTQITGWAGRMGDLLNATTNSNPVISMNLAIKHLNVLQTGESVAPYVVDGGSGAEVLQGYGNASRASDRIFTAATDSMAGEVYQNLLKETYRNSRIQAIDAADAYNASVGAVPLTVQFPNTTLGRGLRQIALAIGAQADLGHGRQTFFLERGGWDHHDNLLTKQAEMLPDVAASFAAFNAAMAELGRANDVVLYTVSDFARTLNSNGNGSDHAWGGNHIIMGGRVQGGRVYGQYPDSLAPGNALDLGRGRLIPTTSVDEYHADLALWFGLANSDLDYILPNIRNFYASGAATSPLGMLV